MSGKEAENLIDVQMGFDNFFTIRFSMTVEKWGEKRGENEHRILDILSQNNKASIAAIVAATDLSSSGVEKIFHRLKTRGFLKRVGPAKGGHWELLVRKDENGE